MCLFFVFSEKFRIFVEIEMTQVDTNKYTIVYQSDIIPNTNFGVYRKYNVYYLISKKNIVQLDDTYIFEGIAVTHDYYEKAMEVKEKYDEIKSYNDSIRSIDEQYEDPDEWYSYDEYKKYWDENRWLNKTYWEFSKIRSISFYKTAF